MTDMKRTILTLLAVALLISLAACGGSAPQTPAPAETQNQAANAPAETQSQAAGTSADTQDQASNDLAETVTAPLPEETGESAAEEPAAASGSDTLIVYFSATGTTKGVAEKLAALTGADLYEILPLEPYSDADLNYNDRSSRSTKEQNDKTVRPEIAGAVPDLDGYTTIYVGYPIWWGEEPRILDTFMESCDFSGKTMIPFCTSASSGIGSSGKNLERLTDGAQWLEGRRFGGGVTEDELRAWTDGLA